MELATTKLLPVYASLVALLTVAGCSESDKSTSPEDSSETSKVVDTKYELGKCTDKLEGTARLVSDEEVYYICTDNDWVKAIEEKSSERELNSSSDEESSSSATPKSSSDIEDSGESSSETSGSSSSVTESSSSVKSSSSSKVESSSSSKVESETCKSEMCAIKVMLSTDSIS